MSSVYINGKLYPPEQALIPVSDRGFLYGDGIFETLRAYQGKIFQLDAHLNRLFASAAAISLKLPYSKKQFFESLKLTLSSNGLMDACLRLTVTRGSGAFGLDPTACLQPTVVITARPAPSCPVAGVTVIIAKTRRIPANALNPEIKSLNFLNNILAKLETRNSGAYEALMLNQDGYLCEGTVSNVFWWQNGALKTPSPGVGLLSGITRKVVLELAQQAGIPCEEGFYEPTDLIGAEEIFLTNSGVEILPVRLVNERPLEMVPGKITQRLQQIFQVEIQRMLEAG